MFGGYFLNRMGTITLFPQEECHSGARISMWSRSIGQDGSLFRQACIFFAVIFPINLYCPFDLLEEFIMRINHNQHGDIALVITLHFFIDGNADRAIFALRLSSLFFLELPELNTITAIQIIAHSVWSTFCLRWTALQAVPVMREQSSEHYPSIQD